MNEPQGRVQQIKYIYGSGPYPEVPRISLTDSKLVFERKDAVFLDVRNAEYYNRGHIRGAVSIPEVDIQNKYVLLSPSDWIIIYCS